jgi:hypothetical protein
MINPLNTSYFDAHSFWDQVIQDTNAAEVEAFEAEVMLAMEETCPRGHDLNGVNSFSLPGDAARHCRTCKRESDETKRVDGLLAKVTVDRCVNGHPWVQENVYTPPTGGRQCRECRKVRKTADRKAAKGRKAANWQALVDEYEADMRAKGMIL